MNTKSILSRWVASALLPAALVGFLLLPVSAEVSDNSQSRTLETPAEYMAYETDDRQASVQDDENYSVMALPADEYDAQDTTLLPDDDYEVYDDDQDGTVEVVILSSDELADLIGPIALYPDDLLAIVLPAATYPLEIVQAARFLEQHKKNSSLKPREEWDESITALLNYPEVVQLMSDDIDWTWKLGGAVLNQQQDLIAAVESFRDRAYAAGNLKSDDYQTVSSDGDSIEITPTREEVIYVPYYEPRRVVVHQVEPVYYYYPRAYPVYYYPYASDYHFSSGYFWGVTTAFRIGWSNHYLHVHHHSLRSHPYYGHRYSNHYYYRQPSVTIYNNWYVNGNRHRSPQRYRDGDYWRPRPASGVRPDGHRRAVRHNDNGRDNTDRRRSGLRASQPSDTRPVIRTRNTGVSANQDRNRQANSSVRHNDKPDTTRRPDRVRDRDGAVADDVKGNRRGTVRDNRDSKPGSNRKPDNTIRFRDRPDSITASNDDGNRRGNTRQQDNSKPGVTRKPDNANRSGDRPNTATASATTGANGERPNRRGTVREYSDVKPGTLRQPDNVIRFRDRSDTAVASTNRETPNRRGTVRDQSNAKPVSSPKPGSSIQFRDRSKPIKVAAQPASGSNTERQVTQRRPQRANTSAARPGATQPVVRDSARPTSDRRNTERRNTNTQRREVVSQRPVASEPAPAQRAPAVRNQTVRQAPAQAKPERQRAQPDREAKPQRKAASERKESGGKSRKGQKDERQKKRGR